MTSESKKIKVAILSDGITFPTGYRNQAKQLAFYLHDKGFEVHYFSNGTQGMSIKNMTLEDGTVIPFHVHAQHKEPYFKDKMSHLLKSLNIDFFIILLDTFMLWGNDGWFLKIDTSPAQTAFWFPSDGGAGMPNFCESILRKVEFPVAMAKFGQKQVKDYYNIDTKYIPHGVNVKSIYRMDNTARTLLRTQWGLNDKFVIGCVQRNQSRKMPDRFIRGVFALVKKLQAMKINKDWVVLMHTDFDDVAAPVNIRYLIQRYGLENRVISTNMNALTGFPDSKMNEIYNLFDAFYMATSGEGFGIPIIESMAAQVPVVVTNYTTTEEIVIQNKAGFGVDLVGMQSMPSFFEMNAKEYDEQIINGTFTGGWHVDRGLMDANDAATKLLLLMENPQLCKTMGENGRSAVLSNYDFEAIVGPAWEALIRKAVSGV